MRKRLNSLKFTAQLWKMKEDGTLLNKLRRWRYHSRNTTIPKVGTTGMIKVHYKGEDKILTFHNLTRAVQLVKNVSSLESYYSWRWKVEAADNGGWSRITNPDGLFLTTKLSQRFSTLHVEKEGMPKSTEEQFLVNLF